MKYSPRKTSNVGLTDGEGVERLWSFMRHFAKITKKMSADKRDDVLTDAALHYGEHVLSYLGKFIIIIIWRVYQSLFSFGEKDEGTESEQMRRAERITN